MESQINFYSIGKLLKSLLAVPAPHDFWMEAICVNKDPELATRRYIANAVELQHFSKLELEEIKNEPDPLGSALIRLKLKSYPQLNVPSIRALLIETEEFSLRPELIKALTYGLEHHLPSLREIVASSFPLELAKNLVVIKQLSIDAGFERRFIAMEKQNSAEGKVSVALDEIRDLSKECCELIIKTDLNDDLFHVLKILPNRIFTSERCEKLAKKTDHWFFAFKEAVILFANRGTELMEIIDLLIDSPHPQQFTQGTTALIQAKLFNAQGVGLLKEAENSKKLNPIVTALQDLAEGGLLTNAVVDVLFKQVSKHKAPAQADTTPSLKVV